MNESSAFNGLLKKKRKSPNRSGKQKRATVWRQNGNMIARQKRYRTKIQGSTVVNTRCNRFPGSPLETTEFEGRQELNSRSPEYLSSALDTLLLMARTLRTRANRKSTLFFTGEEASRRRLRAISVSGFTPAEY